MSHTNSKKENSTGALDGNIRNISKPVSSHYNPNCLRFVSQTIRYPFVVDWQSPEEDREEDIQDTSSMNFSF